MPHRDPAARKKYRHDHYLRNRDKYIEAARAQRQTDEYRQKQPERSRRSLLKIRYGITPEQYEAMLLEQGGRCAICQTDRPNNGYGDRWFDIDHDHTTGKVRGLLCRKCNAMLGHLEKDAEHLADAYRYLGFKLTLEPIDPKP